MDAIWTIYLQNDFMIKKMLIKPSQFYIPFTSLYSRYTIWQIKILIAGRSCVFSHSYDDAVFTMISCVIYITCSKMSDGVFTSLQLSLRNTSLRLQCHVFILDDSYLVVTVCDSKLMSSLDLNDTFLVIFLYLVGQLLPNMGTSHHSNVFF